MMAAHNVVFAVDVDCRSEELNLPSDLLLSSLKQWILKVLLSLGCKYGFENVRWGYKFFHSRTVKSASLITRGTDFKELQEKAFSDFEGEFVQKVGVNQISSDEQNKLRPSPAICVQNTLKEILLDFQWDRPDITSPTKLSLRPRRSTRNATNIPLADDDISYQGENVLFLVSKCPYSGREMMGFLQLCSGNIGSQRDLHDRILPKGLIDMLIHRKVALHWADCSFCEVNNDADDHFGLKTIMEVLQPVAGKVIPVLTPGINLNHKDPNLSTEDNKGVLSFPTGSSTGYILSSEKTYKRAFPALTGMLCWGSAENKQTCDVSLEPVSCRQRRLCAPVEVTLRSVLRSLDICRLKQSSSESWVLFCPQKSEQNHVAFQSLFNELFILASDMVAEVSEGGQVHSAVLSVLSSSLALLTVLHNEEPLSTCLVPSESTDFPDTSDLPDIVSSVLKDIVKDEDTSEQRSPHQIPEWATQELQQWTNLTTEFVESWFPLSDQSGISCHLMESMRLLYAAPEEQTDDDIQEQELTSSLAEFYQNNKNGPSSGLKGKKRGTQRTPVRQKMKTMSRSLQMLNVARFNVKAQKSQTETDSSSTAKSKEKRGKRCSSERIRPGPMHFKNKDELLSHLNLRYQQAVEDKGVALITQVQDLLSGVETFIKSHVNTGASFLNIIRENLLKSTQSIRQLYGSTADAESKIRDCQLQVVLRLELCKPLYSDDQDHVEQMAEEMAGMLRVISLTKDPVFLSKFMQEEVLTLYLTVIPKVLADVYHSLGTQLPEVLVAVLPADFFSDDSMAKESISVSPSPVSATQSLVSSVGDRLEELRNRSAKKRRTNMLTRHKSMTEATQNLRQIQMPRKSTRQAKPKECIPPEKLSVGGQPTQKQTVQEVTKVRRNLFNQETMSSPKKAKMPRSQSVSAVDIIKKRKRSQMEDGRHALLTKKVSETPLHKQVSNRLLYRQRNNRNSGDTDMVIVEESPVKPATDLRRSPRIKKLARRHSSVFYSSSQARSRNLDRALSSSQLPVSESKGGINIKAVKSPMRLLFGAAESPARPSTSRSIFRGDEGDRLGSTDSVFENCNKTPRKSPYKQLGSAIGSRNPRTPSSSPKAQNCFVRRSPGCAVGESSMVLRGSPFRSPASKSLVLETPKKSPLKGILKTPVKTPSGSSVRSPNIRTPRKSVTWSPSPWKGLPEQSFKVPDSPVSSIRFSPRLITPSKLCRDQGDIFKTPEKSNQQKNSVSPKSAQRVSEITSSVGGEQPQLRSEKFERTISLPEKCDPQSPNILFYDHPSPPTPGIKTPSKSPGPTHTMCTRSGRTPPKHSSTLPLDQVKGLTDNSCHRKDTLSLNKERSPELTHRSPSSGSNTPLKANHRTALTEYNQALRCETWTTKNIDGQNESNQMMEEASSSDTPQLDSSQFSATSTEESIDIAEAAVVKTELTDGIKMNISFSRKSSKLSEVFKFTDTPPLSAKSTQQCSRYGFRQTPDRQQRKAAARLGYSPGLPFFSSPRASGTPVHRKKQPVEPNPLTYQVELEMQASGLPKLKFKRTDSFNSSETFDDAAKELVSHVNTKPARVDSPLTHCYKHREPGCISPSHCTPGKGGVQKYICQSITPTRLLTNSPSPLGHGEHMPWTPSPQSRGRSTPENFRTWPRKKRARTGLLGNKEVKEGVEVLEDPELEGVFRLPGTEETKECMDAPAFKCTLGVPSKLCTSEEMDCAESVVHNSNKGDSMKCDEWSWISRNGSLGSVVTPPHSKVKKPVSASGIFALTQSPLLYKGKKAPVTKETTQSVESSGNSEQHGSKGIHMCNVSPISQPRRRQACGRTYSRKRLLDPQGFDDLNTL